MDISADNNRNYESPYLIINLTKLYFSATKQTIFLIWKFNNAR